MAYERYSAKAVAGDWTRQRLQLGWSPDIGREISLNGSFLIS
jgi:hypothetical protein